MKYEGKIIDSHLHMHGGYDDTDAFFGGMEQLSEAAGNSTKNVVMVPQWDREFISQNQLGILYKAMYQDRLFCYAGFDYYFPAGVAGKSLKEQAEEYAEMGFDGIKMVELKPTVYKNLGGVDIQGQEYDEMFGYLEEIGMPLLFHVGDPETFWNPALAPGFAVENGWFYGNGDYPDLEFLYADVVQMLERHPRLKVVFAHFFFLSDDLERAARVLDQYPQVRFDLTPGTEMYGNFSKRPDAWRKFFQTYEDRILFGTDNGWGSMVPMSEKIEAAVTNQGVVRRFLETSDSFEGYDMKLQGLDLPVPALEKIYYKNYEAMAGSAPKQVKIANALAYHERMMEIYRGTEVPFYDRVFPQMELMCKKLKSLLGEG